MPGEGLSGHSDQYGTGASVFSILQLAQDFLSEQVTGVQHKSSLVLPCLGVGSGWQNNVHSREIIFLPWTSLSLMHA